MCILDAHLHHPDPKALAKRILQTPRMSKGEENWSSELGKVGGWGEKHQMRISAEGKGEGERGREREVGVGVCPSVPPTVRSSVRRWNMRWREIGAARAAPRRSWWAGGGETRSPFASFSPSTLSIFQAVRERGTFGHETSRVPQFQCCIMSDERCEGGDREMETGKRMARSSVSEWSPKGGRDFCREGRVKRGDAG